MDEFLNFTSSHCVNPGIKTNTLLPFFFLQSSIFQVKLPTSTLFQIIEAKII